MVPIIVIPSVIAILIIAFSKLAKEHNRNSWYGSVGILVFLVCFFIAKFISERLLTLLLDQEIIEESTHLGWLTLSILVIGITLCRFCYKMIEKNWIKNKVIISNPDILDDEMMP